MADGSDVDVGTAGYAVVALDLAYGAVGASGRGWLDRVEHEARVGVLGEREQRSVEGRACVGVEGRKELVLDSLDDGPEASELALPGAAVMLTRWRRRVCG